MKFCRPHWDALRKAIEDRGLSHLVAKDGKQAIESTALAIEGKADLSDFDPLLSAYFAIVGEIVRIRGLYYMDAAAGCPMCEPDPVNPNWADNWIQGAAEECLLFAQHHKLVAMPH